MYTVYSKPNCQHCDAAKALLNEKGLQYTEIILDVGQQKQKEKTYITRDELLVKIPTARTMPQIMLNGAPVGGYAELRKSLA